MFGDLNVNVFSDVARLSFMKVQLSYAVARTVCPFLACRGKDVLTALVRVGRPIEETSTQKGER